VLLSVAWLVQATFFLYAGAQQIERASMRLPQGLRTKTADNGSCKSVPKVGSESTAFVEQADDRVIHPVKMDMDVDNRRISMRFLICFRSCLKLVGLSGGDSSNLAQER
jgi:hypothetical protein